MTDQIFRGKRAVISGAAGTIGFAVAQRIIKEGGSVILLGRREQPLKEAITKLGKQATYEIVDVDSDEAVSAMAERLDQIDVLVCTAGWTISGPTEAVPVDQAVALFNTRFFGQCRLIKSTLPKFSDEGLILMCSGIGNKAYYPFYAYGAAIANAIEAFAENLAVELAPRKIRVNVISPGWTPPLEADLTRSERALSPYITDEKQAHQFLASTDSPMHEAVTPQEFADSLVFIAKAKHYTGQVIRLDGGRSLTDRPIDGDVDPLSYTDMGSSVGEVLFNKNS